MSDVQNLNSRTMGATGESETAYPSGAPEFTHTIVFVSEKQKYSTNTNPDGICSHTHDSYFQLTVQVNNFYMVIYGLFGINTTGFKE